MIMREVSMDDSKFFKWGLTDAITTELLIPRWPAHSWKHHHWHSRLQEVPIEPAPRNGEIPWEEHSLQCFQTSWYQSHLQSLFKVWKLKEIPKQQDSLGCGTPLNSWNTTLDNLRSCQVSLEIIQQNKPGITLDSNGGLEDPTAKLTLNIHTFMADLQLLCHTTECLGVGWMTKNAMHSPINMLNGPQNVVFKTLEGAGGFSSGCHKGLFATGMNKEILWFLPYWVFLLLYILIHIIQPIKLAVLLEQFIKFDKQHIRIKDYWERIWASLAWHENWSICPTTCSTLCSVV